MMKYLIYILLCLPGGMDAQNVQQFYEQCMLRLGHTRNQFEGRGPKLMGLYDTELGLLDSNRVKRYVEAIQDAVRAEDAKTVLYVGCGPFAPLYLLCEDDVRNVKWTLCDINPVAIYRAKQLTRSFGTSPEFTVGDATKVTFPKYDLVIVATGSRMLSNCHTLDIIRNVRPVAKTLIPQGATVSIPNVWEADMDCLLSPECSHDIQVDDAESTVHTRLWLYGNVWLMDGESLITMPLRTHLRRHYSQVYYDPDRGVRYR